MKTTTKFAIGSVAVVALSAGVAGVTAYAMMEKNQDNTSFYESFETASPLRTAAFDASSMQPVDLTKAAESTLNSVVHIMSIQRSKIQTIQGQPDIFDFFFGDGRGRQQQVQTPEQRGFGSGVIISKDGYIVTNNHVIDGADEINVKLHDGREMKGRVIGTDPTTDLALVKIEGDDFPAIVVGNSDNLKVGEWVLAVGNPFNLGSTVTAGVVSAKSRGLGANQVESFIQTDAAINQGNSGGALVNAKGELVGINAMLYSPTGAYSGYGFAIPVSIMTKVVTDLKQYGTVQRALLGSGLLPNLGIFHKSRYNAFPLADDVMEPYRPFVDEKVFRLYGNGITELNKESKAEIMRVLNCDVNIGKVKRPLQIALTITTASLVKYYSGEIKKLSLPIMT